MLTQSYSCSSPTWRHQLSAIHNLVTTILVLLRTIVLAITNLLYSLLVIQPVPTVLLIALLSVLGLSELLILVDSILRHYRDISVICTHHECHHHQKDVRGSNVPIAPIQDTSSEDPKAWRGPGQVESIVPNDQVLSARSSISELPEENLPHTSSYPTELPASLVPGVQITPSEGDRQSIQGSSEDHHAFRTPSRVRSQPAFEAGRLIPNSGQIGRRPM